MSSMWTDSGQRWNVHMCKTLRFRGSWTLCTGLMQGWGAEVRLRRFGMRLRRVHGWAVVSTHRRRRKVLLGSSGGWSGTRQLALAIVQQQRMSFEIFKTPWEGADAIPSAGYRSCRWFSSI